MTLAFDVLRRDGRDIRVHGNGFIQVDMPDDHRVHFWGHPDIPRQRESTPIHDHAWDMRSMVLRGRIVNVVWRFVSSAYPNNLDVYTPVTREGHDTVLVPTGDRGRVDFDLLEMVTEGDTYSLPAGVLHETWLSVPAVTMIKKITPHREAWDKQIRVLCTHGKTPDNNFTRYDISTDRLWEIAREMME